MAIDIHQEGQATREVWGWYGRTQRADQPTRGTPRTDLLGDAMRFLHREHSRGGVWDEGWNWGIARRVSMRAAAAMDLADSMRGIPEGRGLRREHPCDPTADPTQGELHYRAVISWVTGEGQRRRAVTSLYSDTPLSAAEIDAIWRERMEGPYPGQLRGTELLAQIRGDENATITVISAGRVC